MDNKDEEANHCRYVIPHSNDTTINSKAIVKLQTVASPANFSQLQCNTNLRLPPSNWLTNSEQSYGLQQALTKSSGFTSFRMAHMFPDCLGEVDVVSNAENIKNLLKLPYSPKSSISLMVHRIENTLLIDDFDIYKYLLRQSDDDWDWLKTFICEHVLPNVNDRRKNIFIENKSRAALQKKSLLSKFLYHSISSSSASASTGDAAEQDEKNDKSENSRRSSMDAANALRQLELLTYHKSGPLLPEPSIDGNVPDPKSNHIYNRNVVWTFEDIRMLIGTDMPIFGGATRPCISLRLRDMSEPINVLTGIDYWLDNLMCNVPEVVMCYHLDGLVQKYEIIKTEDLPYMNDSTFSPKVIKNVAQSILAFLKQNATKAGHTYWLFKGRHDDFVKLYDLTSLCTSEDNTTAAATTSSSNNTDTTNTKTENPFTVPVAMLLYKVAKNMKKMNEDVSPQQAASIKALLDNCLKLLPKEKYPQIVTSSHYILSDLHIPISIDPAAPNFNNTTSEIDAQQYDEDDDDSPQPSSSSSSTTSGWENGYSIINTKSSSSSSSLNEDISKMNICEAVKEVDKNWKKKSAPELISGTVVERCRVALKHIAIGLDCLQYFSSTEEKLFKQKEELAKEEEKRQIRLEEQHPNMAKRNEAIPLPYQPLKPEPQPVNPNIPIAMGWKDEDTDTTKNVERPTTLHQKSSPVGGGGKKSKRNRNKKMAKKSTTAGNTTTENCVVEKNLESPRSLLLQGKSGVIESWNVHLKLLLLEKASLVYEILSEQSFQLENYGTALRYILSAMKCQQIVQKYMKNSTINNGMPKICLLIRAGDCYYQLTRHVNEISKHIKEFHSDEDDVDKAINDELLKDLEDIAVPIELPEPNDNFEQLMLISCNYYQQALLCATITENSQRELYSRLGSVLNELGVKYMHWAEVEYTKFYTEATAAAAGDDKNEKQETDELLYQTLSKKSLNSLKCGIEAFEKIGDNSNLAILLCNMGRFMRFRAHCVDSCNGLAVTKKFYESAFEHYQRARGLLDTRDNNSDLWDLVTWELSTSKFTLAQQLFDCYIAGEQTDEIEQEIIDLLMGTIKLCDIDTLNSRQIVYAFRVGIVYQKLATIYMHSYKRANTDARKKQLLHLCRMYYEKSAKTFEKLGEAKEYLETQINRIDLQDDLCDGTQNATIKQRYLQTSLEIFHQSSVIFDKIVENQDITDDILNVMERFEQRLQTILKHLIKMCMTNKSMSAGLSNYKRIYSKTLRSPGKLNVQHLAEHLKLVLENLLLE